MELSTYLPGCGHIKILLEFQVRSCVEVDNFRHNWCVFGRVQVLLLVGQSDGRLYGTMYCRGAIPGNVPKELTYA